MDSYIYLETGHKNSNVVLILVVVDNGLVRIDVKKNPKTGMS